MEKGSSSGPASSFHLKSCPISLPALDPGPWTLSLWFRHRALLSRGNGFDGRPFRAASSPLPSSPLPLFQHQPPAPHTFAPRRTRPLNCIQANIPPGSKSFESCNQPGIPGGRSGDSLLCNAGIFKELKVRPKKIWREGCEHDIMKGRLPVCVWQAIKAAPAFVCRYREQPNYGVLSGLRPTCSETFR